MMAAGTTTSQRPPVVPCTGQKNKSYFHNESSAQLRTGTLEVTALPHPPLLKEMYLDTAILCPHVLGEAGRLINRAYGQPELGNYAPSGIYYLETMSGIKLPGKFRFQSKYQSSHRQANGTALIPWLFSKTTSEPSREQHCGQQLRNPSCDPRVPNQTQRAHLELILNMDFRRVLALFQPVPSQQTSSQKSGGTGLPTNSATNGMIRPMHRGHRAPTAGAQ